MISRQWLITVLCLILSVGSGERAYAQETLDLEDCIRIAQMNGPAARMAAQNYQAREWQYQAFRSSLRPQITLSGNVPQLIRAINPVEQNDGSLLYLPQSHGQSSVGLSVSQVISTTGGRLSLTSGLNRVDEFGAYQSHYYRATPMTVNLHQPLFQHNPYHWNREIQNIRYRKSRRMLIEEHLNVALQATDRYFTLYLAQINLKISALNAAVNDTIYTISQGRYRVGKIAENELLQSELALMDARARLEQDSLAYEKAEQELRILLGYTSRATISIQQPQEIPSVQPDPELAIKHALASRSEILTHQEQRLATEQDLARAQSEQGLSLTLTASYGYNQRADELQEVYSNPLDQQYLNLQMEFPIFTWGKGAAEVEAARAELERLQTDLQLRERRLREEVYYQVRELAQLRRQVRLKAKADTIAARRFEVAKNRYLIGKIDITNMLLAQSEKDAARRSYVQTLRQYWMALHQLQRLTAYDYINGRAFRTGDFQRSQR